MFLATASGSRPLRHPVAHGRARSLPWRCQTAVPRVQVPLRWVLRGPVHPAGCCGLSAATCGCLSKINSVLCSWKAFPGLKRRIVG